MLSSFAARQVRSLRQALAEAGISVHALWWCYFSSGGTAGRPEVDAYVHQVLDLPGSDRDPLQHASTGLIAA
jgi:hypothetical protein